MDVPSASDRGISRRSALAAGAGLLGVSGLTAATGSGLTGSGSSGKCVLVYDDCPIEDYTKTFPVHQEKDAPGCFGVVPDYLGTNDQLTADHVLEMADAGWEVLSHTQTHDPIGWVPVAEDAPAGSTEIPVTFDVHGDTPGAPARVLDDAGAAYTGTIERDHADASGQEHVVLEDGIPGPVDASETGRLRFTSEFVDRSLSNSRVELEGLGLTVNSAVAPYQIYDEFAASKVGEHYAACANGVLGDGVNLDIDPYWLNRGTMTYPSLSQIRSRAATVAEEDGLYLLGSHSWDAELTPDRIASIIDIVREEGLEIVTLNEVLVDAGVVSGGSDGGTGGERHELLVEGTGPTVEFTATVTDEIWGAEGTLESSDSVGTDAVEGQVSTLDDTYYYYGSLTSFDVTSGSPDDVDVSVDGEPLPVGEFHSLEVQGSGPVTQFEFSVTGEIRGAEETWEDSDSVGTSTAEGQVSTLDDTYTYTGELREFTVTSGDPADVTVLVDGSEVDVGGTTPDHELVVQGSGPVTEFSFSVTGEVLGDAATWESSDSVGSSTVTGQVSTLDDTYTYTGELEEFVVTSGDPADVTVLVDGSEISVSDGAAPTHELVVEGSGPVTEFTFSVTGEVTGDSSTWESSDSVGTTTVEGQVSTLDDTYTYTGSLEEFTVTSGSAADVTVLVDGSEISVADPDHRMVVRGTGEVVKFTFSVTGEVLGDSSTWESSDSVRSSTVDGQVSTLDDVYTYTGELDTFDVTEGSPEDVEVTVDGEPVAVDGL